MNSHDTRIEHHDHEAADAEWRRALMEGDPTPRRIRRLFRLLPSSPRCKLCNSPFKGWGSVVMRLIGRRQSRKNPSYCEPCAFQQPGGAEVELSMLFADVRGSTTIAEGMPPAEYSRFIERFYADATDILVREDALIDRLAGDQVVALFVPGFAGSAHASRAVRAARALLHKARDLSIRSTLLPIGVGVHTGRAFVGVVSSGIDGLSDFTMLGDDVNVTARLASAASAGEILISDAALSASGEDSRELEHRVLQLKGKSVDIGAYVVTQRERTST